MQALKFETHVAPNGTVHLPRLRLKKGTPVEVIVLVRDPEDEFTDLTQAAATTLDFWDNPIDDKAWNDA